MVFTGRNLTVRLYALIGFNSLIISLYALSMSQKIAPAASQNDLEKAAISVAEDLSGLTVLCKRLGRIGLCDRSNPGETSLNRLLGTLRLDGLLARQLQSAYLTKLVEADFVEVQKAQVELANLLRQSIRSHAPDPASGQKMSIYDKAYKIISESSHNKERRLVSLRIDLGRLKNNEITSLVRVPEDEESAVHTHSSYYLADRDIPDFNGHNIRFYQTADRPLVVSSKDFVSEESGEISSVVLLEATFELIENKKGKKNLIRQNACVVVGAPQMVPRSSVLMLSFPQGNLKMFSSLWDVLSFTSWNKPGRWRQAIGDAVPGNGHLETAEALLPSQMAVDKSLATAFYHWLFSLGPNVRTSLLNRMLNQRWPEDAHVSVPAVGGERKYAPLSSNTALLRDNGAANFAFLYQTEADELGQKNLQAAFDSKSLTEVLPSSSLPLNVDASGVCHLPGQANLDNQLIQQFLKDLYWSNFAGIESRALAGNIITRMDAAISKSESEIILLKEELSSIHKGLDTDEKQVQIKKKIENEESKIASYRRVREQAGIVVANAQKTIELTFELSSHMNRFAAQGLNRIVDREPGYLLSRSLLFVPHSKPVSEEEIYIQAKESQIVSRWASPDFLVVGKPSEKATINGQSLPEFWARQPQPSANVPLFVIFSSEMLTRNANAKIRVLDKSPFASTGISPWQFVYHGSEALLTGDKLPVRWSMLIRDLVANKEKESGEPLPAAQPRWCVDLRMDDEACPGLACEIQLRAPVPVAAELPTGLVLQNLEGKETVPIIPPAPPEFF
ncbi:MAG: hypothetical protein K2W82_01680 [Candidatus Obscuribacterales bacterium]|nr:hypothetical protein [Candidatus Obscuribacterales bacterium]